MTVEQEETIQMIPVTMINVINPRFRNKRSFRLMSDNIREVGLKKPVTVARRESESGVRFDLVCGQGRFEAYQALGQTEIPAIIKDATPEQCLLESLVENLARRKHSAVDLLQDIAAMKKRGHSDKEIATKTGLNYHYVRDVVQLLEKGEERLLRAVDAGQIPITIAVEIAEADDEGVQVALRQAYEKGTLKGKQLLTVRKIADQRRRIGKNLPKKGVRSHHASPAALLRAYKHEAERKRHLIRKASTTRNRLVLVTEALRRLFVDENFIKLLRAEGLETLPRNLATRIHGSGGASAS